MEARKEVLRKIRKVGHDQAIIEIPIEWLGDHSFGDWLKISLMTDAIVINSIVGKALGVKEKKNAESVID